MKRRAVQDGDILEKIRCRHARPASNPAIFLDPKLQLGNDEEQTSQVPKGTKEMLYRL